MNENVTAVIKNTKWTDLSDDHKKLREDLENRIKKSCIDNNEIPPSMVVGAFRIGKTQLLYYLFHYSWVILGIPAIYLKLNDLIHYVESQKKEIKFSKEEFSSLVDNYLLDHISSIKKKLTDPSSDCCPYFPDYKSPVSINEYLTNLGNASLTTMDGKETEFQKLDFNRVKDVLLSGDDKRYLVLIDEFEESYYKLNNLVETTGGGALRQFYEDIEHLTSGFYLIIGCGPASGYEFKTGDKAAEEGRKIDFQIPFPDVNSLRNAYLKDQPKGFVNFIWWLSRARPGWVKKLKAQLEYKSLIEVDIDTFIEKNRTTFETGIDEGEAKESSVNILKYEPITSLKQSAIMNLVKNCLVDLKPSKLDQVGYFVKESSDYLRVREYFYFAKDLLSIDDFIDSLVSDISTYLNKDLEVFDPKNYLRIYLRKILNGISDENNKICIGLVDDDEKGKLFVELLLLPVLSQLLEFISEFEKEDSINVKELTDIIYNVISKLENDSSKGKDIFREIYRKYKVVEPDELNESFIQINLKLLRDIIEQPIGSPNISYKGESREKLFKLLLQKKNVNNLFQQEVTCEVDSIKINVKFLFIPFAELDTELENINKYINELLENDSLLKNMILCVIPLTNEENVEKSLEHPNYSFIKSIKKLVVKKPQDISYQSQKIKDFIRSIIEIEIIAASRQEMQEISSSCIDIPKVINKIKAGSWTSRKEERRTISFFEELLKKGLSNLSDSVVRDHIQEMRSIIPLEQLNSFYDLRLDDYSSVTKDVSKIYLNYYIKYITNLPKEFNDIIKYISDLNVQVEENESQPNFREITEYISQNLVVIPEKKKKMNREFVEQLNELSYKMEPSLFQKNDYSKESQLEKLISTFTSYLNQKERLFIRSIHFANAIQLNYDTKFDYKTIITSQRNNIGGIRKELSISQDKIRARLNRKEENELFKFVGLDKILSQLLPKLIILIEKTSDNYQIFFIEALCEYLNRWIKTFEIDYNEQIKDLKSIIEKLDNVYKQLLQKQKAFDELIQKTPVSRMLFEEAIENPQDIKLCDNFYDKIFLASFVQKRFYQYHLKDCIEMPKKFTDQELKQFHEDLSSSFEKSEKDIGSFISNLEEINSFASNYYELIHKVNALMDDFEKTNCEETDARI